MAAYMKDHFPFFGIKTTERRELLKEHIAIHGAPELAELPAVARMAFAEPEREMHQVAVDLLMRHAKKLTAEHLPLVEDLITTKSWWDLCGCARRACSRDGPEEVSKGHPEVEQTLDRE